MHGDQQEQTKYAGTIYIFQLKCSFSEIKLNYGNVLIYILVIYGHLGLLPTVFHLFLLEF
jgi:hypothetical protein